MSRVIVGYGNDLRGEDAYGIDVLKETKLISTFQLIPEIALEFLDTDEVIFVDASFCQNNQYKLACSLLNNNSSNLTYHISPQSIISILNGVYKKYPKHTVYSMLTNNFDTVLDEKQYQKCIKTTAKFISS